MRVKITKYIYKEYADIVISRVDCNEENIIRLFNIFQFQYLYVIIDSVNIESSIFNYFKKLNVRYTTAFLLNNESDVEVAFMIEPDILINIISNLRTDKPDGLFLVNVENQQQWEQFLYNTKYNNGRKLVKNRLSDICISVMFDKYDITITFNTTKYDVDKVTAQLKQLWQRRGDSDEI